ncbi:hypothetical protein CsSME_00016627 [Camellia sinensis var. sinensis]
MMRKCIMAIGMKEQQIKMSEMMKRDIVAWDEEDSDDPNYIDDGNDDSGSEDENYESDEPGWLNEDLEGPKDDDIFSPRKTVKKIKRQPPSCDQGADEGWYFDPEDEVYITH